MNAYNPYNLNNLQGGYPYSQHRQALVVVSEGEHGPYGTPAFSVDSAATADYNQTVEFAVKKIRNNREEERVEDNTGSYTSVHDFVAAPVPIIHETLVRENGYDWDMIRRVVWSEGFVPDNWYSMSSADFSRHVAKVAPQFPHGMFEYIDILRRQSAVMCDSQESVGNRIGHGKLEFIPVLVDGANSARTIETVVPFIHKGRPRARQVEVFSAN